MVNNLREALVKQRSIRREVKLNSSVIGSTNVEQILGENNEKDRFIILEI